MNMGEWEELTDLDKLLLKHVGLILSESKNKEISLQGPVCVEDIWFNIKMICPYFPNSKDFRLQIQQSLNIKTYSSANLNIPMDWSVEQLIDNLPSLLKTKGKLIDGDNHILAKSDLQKNIYVEITNLYTEKGYEILLNDNCSVIRFLNFFQNEQHFLEVALPTLKIINHSLPSCINWQEMFEKASTLTILLQQYKKYLEELRPFYENFTDIDELCHVVQPSLPTTKENWRLFVLKEKVFLKLHFADPFSPLSSMSVHIIGPTTEVTQLRRIYSEGLRDWDGELDVHKNLLRIFDLCFFPMPPTEGSQSAQQYCNICYCYKLEHSEIPIVSCDNNHCNLVFHTACIKEWFNTLTDGKIFLDVAFGTCPYCKTKLSTSFQEILI